MKEIIIDTVVDSLKILPFLFITFLVLEYLEHKMSKKTEKAVKKAGKLGPLLGGIVGAFPQCGFSVAATNLYATRVISLGTLIAIYLSTSDEMLPILLSENASIVVIFKFIFIKIIVGIIFGFIIDFILRKRKVEDVNIKSLCEDEHCHCYEHSILKSAIKHTLNIAFFIFIISFILNIAFSYLGEELISKIFMKNSILGPFLASLIGLIPNCGASVVLTELYLNNTISFASSIAGLLSSSGVGILLLFKVNKNIKENIFILLTIYFIGVFTGLIINIINLFL